MADEAHRFQTGQADVPDPEQPICARRDEAPAAERETIDRAGMPPGSESFLAGGGVPNVHGAIVIPPGEIGGIAGKGHGLGCSGRQRVADKFLARGRVRDHGGPIRVDRDKAPAVWRKGHG